MLVWYEMNPQYVSTAVKWFSRSQQITWPLRWMLSLRVKEFYSWELDWGPSGCRQLLSPGHIRSVSACLIWALKTWQFTHVRSQIPGALPSAAHSTHTNSVLTHTLSGASSDREPDYLMHNLKIALGVKPIPVSAKHTVAKCYILFLYFQRLFLPFNNITLHSQKSTAVNAKNSNPTTPLKCVNLYICQPI